jgi:hypothetical protein
LLSSSTAPPGQFNIAAATKVAARAAIQLDPVFMQGSRVGGQG